jgi:hypothetical protein
MITFKLNDLEEERFNAFRQKHCGEIEIIFFPNGIASNVYVRCRGCGERIEISDTSCW